jgi:hypothetical protein
MHRVSRVLKIPHLLTPSTEPPGPASLLPRMHNRIPGTNEPHGPTNFIPCMDNHTPFPTEPPGPPSPATLLRPRTPVSSPNLVAQKYQPIHPTHRTHPSYQNPHILPSPLIHQILLPIPTSSHRPDPVAPKSLNPP